MINVSLRIFDLRKVGQDHELQGHRICRWMAFFVAFKMVKMAALSQAIFHWSANQAYT